MDSFADTILIWIFIWLISVSIFISTILTCLFISYYCSILKLKKNQIEELTHRKD